jgi:hypothetical protein
MKNESGLAAGIAVPLDFFVDSDLLHRTAMRGGNRAAGYFGYDLVDCVHYSMDYRYLYLMSATGGK